jgi:hypothetical protein
MLLFPAPHDPLHNVKRILCRVSRKMPLLSYFSCEVFHSRDNNIGFYPFLSSSHFLHAGLVGLVNTLVWVGGKYTTAGVCLDWINTVTTTTDPFLAGNRLRLAVPSCPFALYLASNGFVVRVGIPSPF